jgi:FAD/FMN-containing dehydrogenase
MPRLTTSFRTCACRPPPYPKRYAESARSPAPTGCGSPFSDTPATATSTAAHAAETEVLRVAVALGGTVSAEHGIGLLKVPFLADVMDPVALELARAVKNAFDPRGILNPGKLLP